MKKIILYSLAALVGMATLSSCNDDDDQLTDSRVTTYVDFALNGDEEVRLQAGDSWTDPGVSATLAGEDYSKNVVTTGSVDTSKGGIYKISYSAVNPDGFEASASRTVYVYDKNNFASAYYGEAQYGTRHYTGLPVLIVKTGTDTYHISDILGGFYAFGRYPQYTVDSYYFDNNTGTVNGASYAFSLGATIKLDNANKITVVSMDDWYFGADKPTLNSGTYDPQTGTVKLDLVFGAPFTVTLTK